MTPNLRRVWDVLSEREATRVAYSASSRKHFPDSAEIFYSVANSTKNRASNRYSNVQAYDRTAVCVDEEGYLNANVVCDEKGGWCVATQAPVPGAFHAFLRAIYTRSASRHPELPRRGPPAPSRRRVAILVQLTGWDERGILKADRYIPEHVPGENSSYASKSSPYNIHTFPTSQTRLSALSSTLTELVISATKTSDRPEHSTPKIGDDKEEMTVYHYHFHSWPDHGVPEGKGLDALHALILEVARKREEFGGLDACEVWVHCSAGVGRTGAFIALASLFAPAASATPPEKHLVSPLGPLPPDLAVDPVARSVDGLREWRGMLVQNSDQLQLVYDMLQRYGQ